MKNLQVVSDKAFPTDKQLIYEIHALFPTSLCHSPLGIVLLSSCSRCRLCDGKLLIRSNRPSHTTLYTETSGTTIGTHFHKYCHNFAMGVVSGSTTGTVQRVANLSLSTTPIEQNMNTL